MILNCRRIAAIVLLFIVSINALAAEYSFMTDPSGVALGITTAYLKNSAPFKNYFVPGIILFLVNGVLSMTIVTLAVRNHKFFPVLLMIQEFTGRLDRCTTINGNCLSSIACNYCRHRNNAIPDRFDYPKT